jgi:hypothetical protein
MHKLDMELAEQIYEVVGLEQNILQKMLETLDSYEAGRFSVPITSLKALLSKIEDFDFSSAPSKAAKRTAKIARFLHTILMDLRHLVKESQNSPNKDVLLREIDDLLKRVKKLLDNFYYQYYYIPPARYIEHWWYGYRNHYNKYLPPIDYEQYYSQIYPDKRKYYGLEDSVWHDVVYGKPDLDESTLFVPKQFQGTQAEYDEYLIWKAKKELEQMRDFHYKKTPLELQRESDKLLDVADKIIRAERRRYMQP